MGGDRQDLRREMTIVAGWLYLTGAMLVGLALVLPSWPGLHRGPLVGFVATAAVVGAGLLAAVRLDRPLTVPMHAASALLGTLVVSGVVVAGGPQASGALGVFYVFVIAFSFYYFPLSLAAAEVALGAGGYAVALALLDVPGAVAQWLVVIGANLVAGAVIGRLGQRVRAAFEAERASVARLRELDQLKDAFLRAVSHELRTPLTGVIGGAKTVYRRWRDLDDATREHLLERTVENAERLERLLGDLLDIDRISRGVVEPQREPTALGDLLVRVVRAVDAPDHRIEVDGGGVVADVDASKVERIVENLVANAVRHTPAGTNIRVAAAPVEDGCLLTVEDDGPGVDDELRPILFEPFSQGSEAAGSATPGTGIGLSLVARFAQLHGGRAWLEDRPGGGTRIRVHLPADVRAGGGGGQAGVP